VYIPRLVGVAVLTTAMASAQTVVLAAGYAAPYPIRVAPGQLLTFFVSGIANAPTSRVAAQSLPLPYSLAGISATIDELSDPPLHNERVPLLAVAPMGSVTAVSVQIPFGLRTSSFIAPDIPPPATMTLYVNGIAVASVSIAPTPDQIHIATTCDADLATPVGAFLCRPLVTHADGSLVTPDQPAHARELLVLYAFGLGATNPGMAAGDGASSPQPASAQISLSSDAAIPAIASTRETVGPIFAGLTVGFSGLYQINFLAPSPPTPFAPAACSTFNSPNGNVALTVRASSSDTARFCVYP
jgi:uncharacterized protein (TIGR03437 family)